VGVAKISLPEECRIPVERHLPELRPLEVSSSEVGLEHDRLLKLGSLELGISEISTSEVGFAQICLSQVRPSKVYSSEVRPTQDGMSKAGACEAGALEVSAFQISSGQILASQVGTLQAIAIEAEKYLARVLVLDLDHYRLPGQASTLISRNDSGRAGWDRGCRTTRSPLQV
jgi:hypothetical protein